jgi:hypothetical protein
MKLAPALFPYMPKCQMVQFGGEMQIEKKERFYAGRNRGNGWAAYSSTRCSKFLIFPHASLFPANASPFRLSNREISCPFPVPSLRVQPVIRFGKEFWWD